MLILLEKSYIKFILEVYIDRLWWLKKRNGMDSLLGIIIY